MRYVKWLAILGAFGAGCAESADTPEVATQQTQSPLMTVSAAVEHDISGPLRDVPVDRTVRQRSEHGIGRFRISGPDMEDAVVQAAPTAPTRSAPTTPGLNFAGVGNGDYGFAPDAAPPDTNGVVGTTQYVQWV